MRSLHKLNSLLFSFTVFVSRLNAQSKNPSDHPLIPDLITDAIIQETYGGFTHWNPNLIYFYNTEAKPTVGYFVLPLNGQNAGDTYRPVPLTLTFTLGIVRKRVAVSVVRAGQTNDLIVKMVNLLPAAVKATDDLEKAGALPPSGLCTVLRGSPDDQKPGQRKKK